MLSSAPPAWYAVPVLLQAGGDAGPQARVRDQPGGLDCCGLPVDKHANRQVAYLASGLLPVEHLRICLHERC